MTRRVSQLLFLFAPQQYSSCQKILSDLRTYSKLGYASAPPERSSLYFAAWYLSFVEFNCQDSFSSYCSRLNKVFGQLLKKVCRFAQVSSYDFGYFDYHCSSACIWVEVAVLIPLYLNEFIKFVGLNKVVTNFL